MAKTTKKTAKKATKKDAGTIVTFLLDRSGSMDSGKDVTMESFNAYLDGMRDAKGITFSLLQFDTGGIEETCKNTPIKEAPELSDANYHPGGGTPLIDAAIATIQAVDEAVANRGKGTKIVVCIQTDGQENASKKTWEELAQLVEKKKALGWEFNFMGAGIDAYQQASRMGIAVADTVSYDHTDREATMAAYSLRGAATRSYAMGLSATMSIGDDEKLASGDRFFKAGHFRTGDKILVPKTRPAVKASTLRTAKPIDRYSF